MTLLNIVIGSVRKHRIGPAIAEWLAREARQKVPFEIVVTDLADFALPMDDEPEVPQSRNYVQPHTSAWSRVVEQADAFVLVFPQCNWGYPAALKNALDHLFWEWVGKPVVTVSYAHHGGEKAARQLREVLTGLRMKPVETTPMISIKDEIFDSGGQFIDIDSALSHVIPVFDRSLAELRAIIAVDHKDGP
jgi:NAD(P)H-dependent FMN reductase